MKYVYCRKLKNTVRESLCIDSQVFNHHFCKKCKKRSIVPTEYIIYSEYSARLLIDMIKDAIDSRQTDRSAKRWLRSKKKTVGSLEWACNLLQDWTMTRGIDIEVTPQRLRSIYG